jgi:hypothetical protein
MTSTILKIPTEYHAMLERLSEIEGSTMSDVIANFLRQAIAAGRLPDQLPGWRVEHLPDGSVRFCVEEIDLDVKLSAETAEALARDLEEYARPGSGRAALLNLDTNFVIERRGTGMTIRHVDLPGDVKKSFSRSVAIDVARLLRRQPISSA